MFEELQTVCGALGSLQSLEIDMTYKGGRKKIIDTFEFAPRLNCIKVIGNFNGREFILPWTQLTSYHEGKGKHWGNNDSMPMMLSLLKTTQKCTALEDLKVSSFNPLDHLHDTSKVPHVSNDNIHHLTAKSDLIIPFLTLPSLQILSLDFEVRITPDTIPNVHLSHPMIWLLSNSTQSA
ncbi:uncharacterized protein EV420DRAFT_1642971 [Desarmillaria tabescens]|uniref:Uncharacterized protein n=1 Tax=Armillaria tabescens TaxID=1929756 RepID=A0AA39KCH3_ARMTA|nr:uncharacterized protein EV420DRAFT_1642971 [Desarmillaria tabescens]KAK0458632.1 hypothetical protein EV420DRAFT_1642971 [Desarmillaria tabescens]